MGREEAFKTQIGGALNDRCSEGPTLTSSYSYSQYFSLKQSKRGGNQWAKYRKTLTNVKPLGGNS